MTDVSSTKAFDERPAVEALAVEACHHVLVLLRGVSRGQRVYIAHIKGAMPSGWLYLESLKRREWNSRFFVLDEGYLRYFTSDDDLDPIATINVKGIEAKAVGAARIGKYAFRLNVTKQEDGRYKYVLAGENESESRQWLDWLSEEGVGRRWHMKRWRRGAGVAGKLVLVLRITTPLWPRQVGGRAVRQQRREGRVRGAEAAGDGLRGQRSGEWLFEWLHAVQ